MQTELYVSATSSTCESVCRCELISLMTSGCTCGAFEMEQKAKKQADENTEND